MSRESPKTKEAIQPSILNFVDSPNYLTAKNRLSRSLKKSETPPYPQRGSSSNSEPRKRKLSSIENNDILNTPHKKFIMSQKDTQDPSEVSKDFNTALKEMAERLNRSFTQTMKNMISPLQISVDSLVMSPKRVGNSKV